jgi:hypothetical protein
MTEITAHLSTEDQIEDIQNEIDRLRISAETGEQWAHICWLEARKVNLRISGINNALRAAI